MKKLLTAAVASTTFLAVSAHAALPAEVDTAFTTLSTDATELFSKAWPVITLVFGGMLLIKLFKRVGNKV